MASLRRPRFGSASTGAGAGGVASYVRHCRRLAQQEADAAVLGVDGPEADEAAAGSRWSDAHNDAYVHGISRGGAGGIKRRSDANNGGNDEQPMDQCIDLLGDHLKTFRDMCLRADATIAAESESGAAPNAAAASSQPDEIPPQLLRVVRFFRIRWPPLKRALLRPPERLPEEGGDASMSSAAVVEVGSPALRLRLARALHARGLLSLAEVDELAVALERRQEQASKRREGSIDNVDGDEESPTKKQKLEHGDGSSDAKDDDLLAARLRLALSRLPSDAGPATSTKIGGGGGGAGGGSSGNTSASTDKARRGMRYAKTVLLEWELRWNAPGRSSEENQSTACPSPDVVADWALTAFAGIVLANGIDHRPGRAGGVGQPDESNLEHSLAAMLLPAPRDGARESASTNPLAWASRKKIQMYLSPAMVDDLTDVHLLSLSRLLSYAPYEQGVKSVLLESIVACSKKSGGVGLHQLSKLVATYLSLVGSDIVDIQGLGDTLKESIREKQDPDEEERRALCFLDAMLQTAKFLLL